MFKVLKKWIVMMLLSLFMVETIIPVIVSGKVFAGETIKAGGKALIQKIASKLMALGVKGNVYTLAAVLIINAVRCEIGWK